MTASDPATPAPLARDRNAKSASRAAALVVAVLAMVVEIAPAVFLIAGGGSLAAALVNAPAERIAPAAAAAERRPHLELVSVRSPAPRAATALSNRPLAPAAAKLLERLALPPPAFA
jgi:hypothetical protein